jgi:peptide/nickel transport system permease protein
VSRALRSLRLALTTLVLLSLAAFLLTTAARGDPALLALRQDGQEPTPALLADYRARLGVDQPLPVRYAVWLANLSHGDLGRSLLTGRPVVEVLGERLQPTLLLGTCALVVSTVGGLALGLSLAYAHDSALDLGARAALSLMASVPSFWLGIALVLILGERWHLLPVAGYGTWQQLVLPTLALSLGPTAGFARLTRGLVLDALHEDYVRTAQAKGLAARWIGVRHLLPNVVLPLVSLTGVRLGHLLGGAIIVESIFGWPGMGSALLAAISGRDLPVICGYVLLTGTLVITARVLADVLTDLLDPRMVAARRFKSS